MHDLWHDVQCAAQDPKRNLELLLSNPTPVRCLEELLGQRLEQILLPALNFKRIRLLLEDGVHDDS